MIRYLMYYTLLCTLYIYRHPSTASRPTFHVLHHALSRDSRRLLSWSKGDTGSHTQASALGAPLETALELYVDLQRTYIISSSSTST